MLLLNDLWRMTLQTIDILKRNLVLQHFIQNALGETFRISGLGMGKLDVILYAEL